jgi:hypothetical protein
MNRRPSMTAPVLVITAGVLLLLDNLDILPHGYWHHLLRLWPAAVILFGLEMLMRSGGGRVSAALSLFVSVTVVLSLVAVAWWAALSGDSVGPRVHEATSDISDAAGLDVEAQLGAVNLQLTASDTDGSVNVWVSGGPDAVEPEIEMRGERALLRIVDREGWRFAPPFDQTSTVTAEIPIGIATTVEIDAGVGDVELDLAQADLTALIYSAGVGESRILLPSADGLSASVNGGSVQSRSSCPQAYPCALKQTPESDYLNSRRNWSASTAMYTKRRITVLEKEYS